MMLMKEAIATSMSRAIYCMARVNVYLPDELAAQVREADVNVSALTQEALQTELPEPVPTRGWIPSPD